MTKKSKRRSRTPKPRTQVSQPRTRPVSDPTDRARRKLFRSLTVIQKGMFMSAGLGEQIRQTRKAVGLSQAAFAPLVGMKANFLSDLEVGKRAIGPKTLSKLIRFASRKS